jgi:hypothetical protein
MKYIRVNKLLRTTDWTLEELSSIFGENINPNTKLGVYREEDGSIDYRSLSSDDLLDIRNNINRILNDRVETMERQYIDLKKKIQFTPKNSRVYVQYSPGDLAE